VNVGVVSTVISERENGEKKAPLRKKQKGGGVSPDT